MSYTVLARKWRPRTFTELSGQEHVQRALINALDNDRVHHGFLFTGTRGVGKTTIARILAKCLNCDEGVTSTPCLECSTCIAIDEGRFVDLIEVDAASRTKVDDTRELLDNVQYAPTTGRYKVYLIDEVHMLSRHSFNALLKTLEEPPPHVKFLLATTDPQRLPATVLSRCLQFNLKRLPSDMIAKRLETICQSESVEFDESSLELLSHGADGSMRDALSLLDQAIAFGGGQVCEEDVRAMLGTVARDVVFNLVEALVTKDASEIFAQIEQMDEYSPNYSQVLQEVALLLQRAAILSLTQVVPRESKEMAHTVKILCSHLNAEQIQLYYQIAIIGRRDLPLAPSARSGFEMVVLRMLAFAPQETPSMTGSGPIHEKTAAQSTSELDSSASTKKKPPKTKATRLSSAAGHLGVSQGFNFSDWPSLIVTLGLQGAAKQLASHCVVVDVNDKSLRLRLAHDNQHLLTQKVRQKLSAVLQNHLGDDFEVMIELGDVEERTPADFQREAELKKARSIKESLLNDPNVRKLQETFDAVLNEDSIKIIN